MRVETKVVIENMVLEDKDIVEIVSGERFIVVGNILLGTDGFLRMSSFNKNLVCIVSNSRDFDIVKIFTTTKYGLGCSELLKGIEGEDLDLVWSREGGLVK